MEDWVLVVITAVGTVFASTGFWTYIIKRSDRSDVKTKMLIGLAHDRILCLGNKYIERGWVSAEEYENLYTYLYEPYEKMGGNGSAKRIMEKVKKLPSYQNEHNTNDYSGE